MNFTDYYQSHKKYFWVWEEEANVLTITGGSTIGFREQVTDILMDLAEYGLPPFGSFLLAMIATNKTEDDAIENVAALVKIYQQDGTTAHYNEPIDEAFSFLKLLQTIPQEYTIGRRRQILLRTLFANSHNRLNAPTSKGIAAALKNNVHGRTRLLTQKDFNAPAFFKDFRTIALLLRQFPTVQSIIEAMGNLPELSADEIPLLEYQAATNNTYEDFVEELMDNTQTFHTAALIKPIWAGFKVPIFNAHPSEQPLGGVSDLSNKGDFDKLLISEFANDDLIFMNRVANNEALYIHREMPPVKDKLHRNILIDISLKTWGTPKILAYAAYIAIARHPKSLSETRAFVLGKQYVPVSCESTGEIIDGLQKVDAGLHAAQGLAAFLEANKHDKQLELFYITTTDALKYPAVQKQLTNHHTLFKYIITTDAEGEINFYRRNNNAQKHLQTIRLPLAKLWTKKNGKGNKAPQPVIPVASSGFVPILMPTPAQIRKAIPFDDDVYIVANKCLYKRSIEQHKKNNKGWQLLLRNVPANSYFELGKLENAQIQFLAFNPQNKELTITNLDTLETAKTIFSDWSGKPFPQFLFNKYHQFIYLVRNPDSFTFEPDFTTGSINIREQRLTSNIFGVDYLKRQKEITDFPTIFPANVLKNVSELYINQSNCLVFNKHQLSYNDSWVGFSAKNDYLKVVSATKESQKGTFTFKDGSKIVMDRCGCVILMSSNQNMSPVYIVPIMDTMFGMATSTAFAGDAYYHNKNLGEVNVTITDAGPQKLSAVKIIKGFFISTGLKEAKEIIDGAPQMIHEKINYTDAVKMTDALKNIGCIATISNPKHSTQDIISAASFYQQNIAIFIKHIIDYATAN